MNNFVNRYGIHKKRKNAKKYLYYTILKPFRYKIPAKQKNALRDTFLFVSGSADLSVALDDVLVCRHFFQSHGSAGMKLLGGDPHFAAQTEFSSVGESGGGVDVHGGAVHVLGERVGVFFGLCQNGFAVPRGMGGDVSDGGGGIVHHGDRQNVIQKFRIEIVVSRRRSVNDLRRFGAETEFHALFALGDAVVGQTGLQKG